MNALVTYNEEKLISSKDENKEKKQNFIFNDLHELTGLIMKDSELNIEPKILFTALNENEIKNNSIYRFIIRDNKNISLFIELNN